MFQCIGVQLALHKNTPCTQKRLHIILTWLSAFVCLYYACMCVCESTKQDNYDFIIVFDTRFTCKWDMTIQTSRILHAIQHAKILIDGILPKGPYLPCVNMAGRALLAGYHRYMGFVMGCSCFVTWFCYQLIAKPGNKIATPP